MKTTAEVHFFFVSPAVLEACQLYSIGVMAAMHEILDGTSALRQQPYCLSAFGGALETHKIVAEQ